MFQWNSELCYDLRQDLTGLLGRSTGQVSNLQPYQEEDYATIIVQRSIYHIAQA